MRLAAAASVALSLAVGASGATVKSGLYGHVTRGPTMPVCIVGQPCTAPAAGAVLTFVRNGVGVARAKAAANGSYRILLAPGLYVVRAGKRPLDPDTVRVRRSRMLRVDFSIDTGIR